MICPKCGSTINDNSAACTFCGANLQGATEQKGMSIASLVLGCVSLITWLIPLFGYPTTIVGLVLGIRGKSKGAPKLAIAGIVLCIVALVATLINSALGAMLAVANM